MEATAPRRSTGVGWYRDEEGNIRTGTNTPDPFWLKRKGFTFLGCAEYGPDGSQYEPLMALGLVDDANKVLENRKQAVLDAERKAELEATKDQREKAALGAAIIEALDAREEREAAKTRSRKKSDD